jgi:predicted permease
MGFAEGRTMSTLAQDLRYAARTLVRAPGFTLVVVLTLGLGIGANTAIFSLMDQVLLRALPVTRPEELVHLDGPGVFSGSTEDLQSFSYPMYADLQNRNQVFDGLVAQYSTAATLTVRNQAERISVDLVSGNLFGVLGVQPAIGRAFTQADDHTPNAHPLVMLGYDYWQRRFAGSGGIVNQTVILNATPMTVIGVAPRGFAGVMSMAEPDLFAPMAMKAAVTPTNDNLANRRSRWVTVFGRLKPGLSREAAKASLDVLYRQILAHELVAVPEFAAASARFKEQFRAKALLLHPAARGLSARRGDFSTPLAVLMGMVSLVLLIASANVANLLLTRAAARQKEMALRLTLGASRWRLVRQTMTESLVLAGAGALLGVLLAIWLGDLLLATLPFGGLARALSTTPDLRVGLFTIAVGLLTAMVFGMAPALQSARFELNRTMRETAGAIAGGRHQARFRKGLVVVQVALSTLLVAGGGLFARSLYNLQHLDRGFDTGSLISFGIDPSLNGYDQPRIRQFYDGLIAEVRRTPGVVSASLARDAALSGDSSRRTIQVIGYEPKPDENMNPEINYIASDYFRTMKLPLVAGREFTDRDVTGAPLVAIVNETFARYYFGRENPLGRRVTWRLLNGASAEIVGVAKDSRYASLRQASGGDNQTPRFLYTPYQQRAGIADMYVYVRTAPDAVTVMPDQLRRVVRRADPSMPIYAMQAVETTVDRALFTDRMLARLSATFGLLATLLAAIGLYGVMSYTVSRRTREIGIRMALGAEQRMVLWLVLREVVTLTLIGIVLGIPAALGISGLVRSQLFGISPNDPLTIAIAASVLGAVGLVAGWLPARRAAAIAPLQALRYE